MAVVRMGALPVSSGFRSSALTSAVRVPIANAITSTTLTRATPRPPPTSSNTGLPGVLGPSLGEKAAASARTAASSPIQTSIVRPPPPRYVPSGPTAPGGGGSTSSGPTGSTFGKKQLSGEPASGPAVGAEYEYGGGGGDSGYGVDEGRGGGGAGPGLELAADDGFSAPPPADGIPKWAVFGAIGLVLAGGIYAFQKGAFG